MTTRIDVVDDGRLGQYLRKESELRDRLRKGVVPFEATMDGLQVLLEGRFSPVGSATVAPMNPLAGYRKIKNLIFVGPDQWNKAMTSRARKNRNPLGLEPDWCPQVPVPYTVEQMKELARFCEVEKDWNTKVILFLALPEIAETPTSLIGQYHLWGVAHDGFGPGVIRQDGFWSNWYKQQSYDWAKEPAVTVPTWMVGYELPCWTTGKNWTDQQKAAADRGMPIVPVVQDTLMLNVVLVATGERLRLTTYSRTSTIYGGYPLDVRSIGDGVFVHQDWYPGVVFDGLGVSVQGVPLELGL